MKKNVKKNTKKNVKSNDKEFSIDNDNVILFNGKMRKTFVEGILQDIKGYFENKTDGKVVVSYEDFDLKGHEFGFRLNVEKSNKCKKQMWSEATSAIVNIVNYMFPTDSTHMDISICTEDSIAGGKLEVDFVSMW